MRDMDRETMVGFGHKQAWLAVRDGAAKSVSAALGLRDLGPVAWRDGIDLAYLTDDRLVLTPPLPGARNSRWILVSGRWLLRGYPTEEVVALSDRLDTEVQLFATYRVAEMHRWIRAVNGVLVRAFGFVGETGEVTEWRGDPDDVERSIGLPPSPDGDPDILVGEEDVLRIAGAWSVDPSRLSDTPSSGPLRAAAAPD